MRAPGATVRLLREDDLADAARFFRRACGTFLGLPDPDAFGADLHMVASRRPPMLARPSPYSALE